MELDRNAAKLLLQVSNTLLNSMTSTIAASDLMAKQLERQPDHPSCETLSNQLAALRHNQFKVLRVVENMKTLAALELKTMQLRKETVDLAQLCTDLADSCRVLVPDIPVKVQPVYDRFICSCDSGLIERLLLNLLANSFLHCKAGEEIRIHLSRTEKTLQIILSDNGTGIPRENMETLFSDFLRDSDFSDFTRGAGLGLSVAEAIARAHGGSLAITGETGHGTKAVFSLPHEWTMQLHGSRAVYHSNGRMRSILTGLADVCDYHKFLSKFL